MLVKEALPVAPAGPVDRTTIALPADATRPVEAVRFTGPAAAVTFTPPAADAVTSALAPAREAVVTAEIARDPAEA